MSDEGSVATGREAKLAARPYAGRDMLLRFRTSVLATASLAAVGAVWGPAPAAVAASQLTSAAKSGARTSRLVTNRFARCTDDGCRRKVLLSTRRPTIVALTALNSSRLQAEGTCDAAWATTVGWGLVALEEASVAAKAGNTRLATARVQAAIRRAERARVVQTSCRLGQLTAESGRFSACIRVGAGQSCAASLSRTLTDADIATGSPQLVTRVVCLGRPFRGHWELRVAGRQPVDSATFPACLSRSHEDFVVPLDLKTIGFAFDQRLTTRTFDATLRVVDDDLDRVEGEAVYAIRFAPLAGASYTQGVQGDWTITSVKR